MQKVSTLYYNDVYVRDLPSHRRIQALPVSMVTMLDKVLRQCGFIGTLIIGGPDPDVPNNIISMIFQSGKTATGMTFGDSYPALKTTMTNSFNTFAHKCLSKFTYTYVYTRTHGSHNTVVDNPSIKPTAPAKERETSLVPKSSTSTEETGGGADPSDITVPDTNLASGTSSGNDNTIASHMEVNPPQSGGQDMDLAPGVSSGDGDVIGSNTEVDRPQSSINLAIGASDDGNAINMEVDHSQSSSQDMDIDIVPFDDVFNGAGDLIQNLNGQNFEVASDTSTHEDEGETVSYPGIRTQIIIYFGAPNRSCESFSYYAYGPSLCLRNITMPTYSHVHMFTYSRSFISDSGN